MGEARRRGWGIIAALAALALAFPAGAAAETFCAPAPCSEGTASATIAAAIAAADTDPGADTVAIKAGTHNLG